jgi:ACS family hexuronate transporter-like MFS transporter
MAGAIGALLATKAVGYIPQFTGSYALVFLIAGSAYLCAFLLVKILAPRIAPISVEGAPA